MHQTIKNLIFSIDKLAEQVTSGYSDDRLMTVIWGWNHPALSPSDLGQMAFDICEQLQTIEITEIDEDLDERLQEIPTKIESFISTTLPYLFNGNGVTAAPLYMALVTFISHAIQPLFGWDTLQDSKAMPKELIRRLRSIQADINNMTPEKEELKNQIMLIQSATSAAESLPTDLEQLREARIKVDKFSTDSAEKFGKIESYLSTITSIYTDIVVKKDEADRLVAQCEEAYRITTTKGLAAAFDQRANRLSNSMWTWVAGLFGALGVGTWICSHRFEVLNQALTNNQNSSYIWVQIVLAGLSLGAPIWFAWVATKQISQRFKLAEDYAFKASVAKAYEGYRKEAARIDEDFEHRLFDSALTRLEEAPLRVMDGEHHGSPWQEFFASSAFQKAIHKVPELGETVKSIFKSAKISNLTELNNATKELPLE